jgi:hypothetical protein
LSVSLLIMFDTLLLRPSLHCNTPLHFTTLHPTTLPYTYRGVTSSHLHFTTLSFSFTHLHFLSFYTSHHITLHHITSHHITSHHITSLHITSHHFTLLHITSHHITSHHFTLHHITSLHITRHSTDLIPKIISKKSKPLHCPKNLLTICGLYSEAFSWLYLRDVSTIYFRERWSLDLIQ